MKLSKRDDKSVKVGEIMKALVFLLFLINVRVSFAQKAKVLIVDPSLDSKEFKKKYQVERPQIFNSLPDKKLRDQTLAGVKNISSWDEVKKDIFYMDLKKKDLKVLEERYPEIDKLDLKKLKESLK
jgi:hypothetical protein